MKIKREEDKGQTPEEQLYLRSGKRNQRMSCCGGEPGERMSKLYKIQTNLI